MSELSSKSYPLRRFQHIFVPVWVFKFFVQKFPKALSFREKFTKNNLPHILILTVENLSLSMILSSINTLITLCFKTILLVIENASIRAFNNFVSHTVNLKDK